MALLMKWGGGCEPQQNLLFIAMWMFIIMDRKSIAHFNSKNCCCFFFS